MGNAESALCAAECGPRVRKFMESALPAHTLLHQWLDAFMRNDERAANGLESQMRAETSTVYLLPPCRKHPCKPVFHIPVVRGLCEQLAGGFDATATELISSGGVRVWDLVSLYVWLRLAGLGATHPFEHNRFLSSDSGVLISLVMEEVGPDGVKLGKAVLENIRTSGAALEVHADDVFISTLQLAPSAPAASAPSVPAASAPSMPMDVADIGRAPHLGVMELAPNYFH